MTNTQINNAKAWRRYSHRERSKQLHDQQLREIGKVDYTAIIDAAEEWLIARSIMFQARVKSGFRKNDNCWLPAHPDIEYYCSSMDTAYSKLHAICSITHVDMDAAIKTAKVRLHAAEVGREASSLFWEEHRVVAALLSLS